MGVGFEAWAGARCERLASHPSQVREGWGTRQEPKSVISISAWGGEDQGKVGRGCPVRTATIAEAGFAGLGRLRRKSTRYLE